MNTQVEITERRIETVFDWISLIAGVPNLLILLTANFIQSFQTFNSNIQMIKSFKEKDENLKATRKLNKFDKSGKKNKNKKRKTKTQKDKSIIELIQMFVMKGKLDLFKKIFCCCRGKPSRIQTELREIEDIERLLVKQFDLQAIIIKISSLLVNQKRILKRLDINPQLVNLMDL